MNDNTQNHSPTQPRPLVLALMLTSILAFQVYPTLTNKAGAVSSPLELKHQIGLIKRELIGQNLATDLSNELPQQVANAVFQDIFQKQGISPQALRIVAAQQKEWPNGCLGLAEKDVFCTEAIVRGWKVVVTTAQQSQLAWTYRTNGSGTSVKLEQSK